ANAANQTRYRVEGMDCASCAAKIDTAVRRLPGVDDVTVSVPTGIMTVHHRAGGDLEAIEQKVRGLGYTVVPLRPEGSPAPTAADGRAGRDHD
ncbi:heavy-metal-associated domain-containing protein, partial [Klebsiella aerogenes]|uniref:heavy-metal-associated domain-containing protein n=1 Tax=Klebsiella aerogenes TaxID=548 RepID=UPI0019544B8E